MNMRTIYAHVLDDERAVEIQARGEITLDTLEAIESFCHRQRVRICRQMSAELASRGSSEPSSEGSAAQAPRSPDNGEAPRG